MTRFVTPYVRKFGDAHVVCAVREAECAVWQPLGALNRPPAWWPPAAAPRRSRTHIQMPTIQCASADCSQCAPKACPDKKCGRCCDNQECARHAGKVTGKRKRRNTKEAQAAANIVKLKKLLAREEKKRVASLRKRRKKKGFKEATESSGEDDVALENCAQCSEDVCKRDMVFCEGCHVAVCSDCSQACSGCKESFCSNKDCLRECELMPRGTSYETVYAVRYGNAVPERCGKLVCDMCFVTKTTICCAEDVTGCSSCLAAIVDEEDGGDDPIGWDYSWCLRWRCCDPSSHY